MSRNEELQEQLCKAGWDLAVFDEAHKLAAHYFGSKLEKTGRFRFAERLGEHTRHLLLMTATPHNGKEEDFQLFLALLDGDRFEGKFRDGVHQVDVSDLMRRMVKENLLKFDGRPLFPERIAHTVPYKLSDPEARLYKDVTEYVTRTLIGLPHGAFVSTFFTRQKELTFFGDRKPTERRVEVARLLGFQTIRDAQEEIAQERNQARRDADSRRAQHERDSAGRDLDGEIDEATRHLTEAEALAALH